jgi:hypothetical protein
MVNMAVCFSAGAFLLSVCTEDTYNKAWRRVKLGGWKDMHLHYFDSGTFFLAALGLELRASGFQASTVTA